LERKKSSNGQADKKERKVVQDEIERMGKERKVMLDAKDEKMPIHEKL